MRGMDEPRNVEPIPATYRDLVEALHRPAARAVDAPEVVGLLRAAVSRAGDDWQAILHIGGQLAQGVNRRMACVGSGLTIHQLAGRLKKNPGLREAITGLEAAGFAAVVEGELRSRAFDRKDRGSARLLELYLKAHSADYREKAQLEISVMERAADSRLAALAAPDPNAAAVDQFGNPSPPPRRD